MSAPLRHRSPVKDAEAGPTPNKTGKTPVVVSPAAAAATSGTGIRGFISRNKKLLIAAGVVGAVVLIAASVQGSKNAAARAANANSLSSDVDNPPAGAPSSGGKNGGGDKTPAPTASIYDEDSTADPSEVPTMAPTLSPTPEVLPLFTPVCNLTGNLGEAPYFNALFSDTFWSTGSSCEGRLGVGNNCWLNQFGVGNGMFTPVKGCPTADFPQFRGGNFALIVSGGLTLNDTTIDNGGLAYGYEEQDVNLTYWNAGSGCSRSAGEKVMEISDVMSSVRTASAAISAMSQALSTTTRVDANTLQFTLNESIMTEYFVVNEADVRGVKVFKLVGTPMEFRGRTATIIINVIKDAANADSSLTIENWSSQGFDSAMAKNVVWNFKGYQTLSFQQGSWFGSILAPDAAFETCIGDFYGGVFGKSWNSKHKEIKYKFHEARFQGLVFTNECT